MRILVTGAHGFLGGLTHGRLLAAGHDAIAGIRRAADAGSLPHSCHLDLLEPGVVGSTIAGLKPDLIVHAAAIGDIRQCEDNPELAQRINVAGTRAVIDAARQARARVIFFSTEQIFDGARAPYSESATAAPLHHYGRTKAAAEALFPALGDSGLILRLPIAIGRSPTGQRSSSDPVLRMLAAGERPQLFVDEYRTPIHAGDIATAIAELVMMPSWPRILNLAGPDRVSRYGLGVMLARAHGYDPAQIDARRQAEVRAVPPRPADLSLDTGLARTLLRSPPRPLAECVNET